MAYIRLRQTNIEQISLVTPLNDSVQVSLAESLELEFLLQTVVVVVPVLLCLLIIEDKDGVAFGVAGSGDTGILTVEAEGLFEGQAILLLDAKGVEQASAL